MDGWLARRRGVPALPSPLTSHASSYTWVNLRSSLIVWVGDLVDSGVLGQSQIMMHIYFKSELVDQAARSSSSQQPLQESVVAMLHLTAASHQNALEHS